MDIETEISKHLEWIDSTTSLIGNDATTKEEIEELSKHDRCELGRWLGSDESGQVQGFTEFERLVESHKAFHALAGELIVAVGAGDEQQAAALGEAFISASQKVVGYLGALQEHLDTIDGQSS